MKIQIFSLVYWGRNFSSILWKNWKEQNLLSNWNDNNNLFFSSMKRTFKRVYKEMAKFMLILMLNCVTQSNSLRGNYKVAFQAYASRMTCLLCHNNICILYTIQDFLCTLGMKSHMHLVKISIFTESCHRQTYQNY